MKALKDVIVALGAIMFRVSVVCARTTDGTINTTEVPVPTLVEAVDRGVEALGTNSSHFICTAAISKRQLYGGGWGIWFRSTLFNTRYVHITSNGLIAENNEASPRGGQFRVPPTISIMNAIELVKRQSKNNVVLSAVWDEGKDEWQIRLLNESGSATTISVNAIKQVYTNESTGGRMGGGETQTGQSENLGVNR